jgi:hypothetical protein
MNKNLSAIIAIAVSILATACSSIPLEPQAGRVIASPNPAPQSCKYRGQVVGNQGNFFTGAWTSNRNLEEGAMNNLRNQAGKLGANYVQIVTMRAGITGTINGSNGNLGGSSEQTNVTNLGNAYFCPPKAIGLE